MEQKINPAKYNNTHQGMSKKQQIIAEDINNAKIDWQRATGKSPEESVPDDVIQKYSEYENKLKSLFAEYYPHVSADDTKSNKRSIRYAIDYNIYQKLLENNNVDIDTILAIAQSAGVRVPQRIVDIAPSERLTQQKYDELYKDIPPVNKEKLKQLIADVDNSFKEFARHLQ